MRRHRPMPDRARPRAALTSYSRMQSASAEVRRPRDVAALTGIFEEARRQGRRVVLRGAGLSFDGQSVDDDLAVSLEHFDALSVDAAGARFTAGPGVTWGAVYRAINPAGLYVPAAVTTASATVGGTLAANSLSRFSPVFGKEGRAIASLDVLTPDGALRTVSRTQEPDVFRAVVGGWGGVGAVVSATYEARRAPPGACVRSTCERDEGFDGLARALHPTGDGRTAYAVISVDGARVRTLVLRAEVVEAGPLRPMLPHRPAHPSRVPIEWAVNRWHRASTLFWAFTHAVYMRGADRVPFVDGLYDFTFFMDGHLRAAQAARRLGVPFGVAQQTVVIPRGDDLGAFLREATSKLTAAGLEPSLVDVLWLPADEPFDLSSTRDGDGYACTFSFEGPFDPGALRRALAALAVDAEAVGGRVHLVKNVCAPGDAIERTYAPGLARYAAVKRRVDPTNTLQSGFLRRCFPSVFGGAR